MRKVTAVATIAAVTPKNLLEPLEEANPRLIVEVFESSWERIAGLDSVRIFQVFRFINPINDEHTDILLNQGYEEGESMYGVALENGRMITNDAGKLVGGAESEFFTTLEEALEFAKENKK